MKTTFILSAALAIHAAIVAHEKDIESLDRAIGDGDHYINIKRGSEAVAGMYNALLPLPSDEVLLQIGNKLLSSIGGLLGHCLPVFCWAWRVMTKNITPKLPTLTPT